jgi:hypothetical protein
LTRGAKWRALNLRVTPDLKTQVYQYARQFDISINAAAAVLFTEGLREVKNRAGSRDG